MEDGEDGDDDISDSYNNNVSDSIGHGLDQHVSHMPSVKPASM